MMAQNETRSGTTPRRTFLSILGLAGPASFISSLRGVTTQAAEGDSIWVTRVATYYNTTSDWMAWIQVMNESDVAQAIKLQVFNLAGDPIFSSTLNLDPCQTQTMPLESIAEVKGKQGMVVLASEEKSIAACMISRKASQPDYTSTIVAFSTTLLSS